MKSAKREEKKNREKTLKGERCENDDDGGADGVDGVDGADGVNGVDGTDGANGADGEKERGKGRLPSAHLKQERIPICGENKKRKKNRVSKRTIGKRSF